MLLHLKTRPDVEAYLKINVGIIVPIGSADYRSWVESWSSYALTTIPPPRSGGGWVGVVGKNAPHPVAERPPP